MQPSSPQRIVKIRRDYNSWVADETKEDYALRFTPKSFRKWSEWRIANTALGAVSFLALEAIGATLALSYGFTTTLWAVLLVSLVIFLTGLPISYYAARYGVDMDLLTRGAGFGYIGSTITSLIYASFTFLFFALEAAIMALALELYFDLPLALAYVICSLGIVPLVAYGITLINRLQMWTQPLWLVLLILPYVFVIAKNPGALGDWTSFAGRDGDAGVFNPLHFGAACTVALALVTQIGEQVDYLRFLPEKTRENRLRWWSALLMAGPGWIIPGALKMLAGAFLAFLALQHEVPIERAAEPTQMYLVAFNYVFASPQWALGAMVLFVIVSQVKINMTNAYAGSLAWSNFFARVTHSHPGRVVWLVFNVVIALTLMELGVFEAIEQVLGLYANIAIAWIGALVADLVINKPLGLSPAHIEFKRAHLYDINPVGVGAMLIASLLSVLAHLGLFGALAQAASPVVALLAALLCAPLIAWYTKGRYYTARVSTLKISHPQQSTLQCVLCSNAYEREDMAMCPAYGAAICSLCCSLDARCGDICKPRARLVAQFEDCVRWLLPYSSVPRLHTRLAHYLGVLTVIVALLSCALALIYGQVAQDLQDSAADILYQGFLKAFLLLSLFAAALAWWVVLTRESRRVAQEESNRQTALLMQEIEAHRKTDEELQKAKEASEAANAAKSRYVTGLSHELRTPLNSILGYAQILQRENDIAPRHREALATIYRSGSHLLSLIDGLLDVARIEAGKLSLEPTEIALAEFLDQLRQMFAPQAEEKGLSFHLVSEGRIPAVVRGDEKRVRQILINLLGNAVRYTERGSVSLRVSYLRETATFEIVDTGIGIPEEQAERLFQPFERGDPLRQDSGLGLGLTITRMLTSLMGGELSLHSSPGQGSRFRIRLFLSEVRVPQALLHEEHDISGYRGPRKRILVVDDHLEHRQVLVGMLGPLGFDMHMAASGQEALSQVSLHNPDLILMDLSMPQLDGWQTSRLIRSSIGSRAPIIIISANAFADGPDSDACDDYLAKPVHTPRLLEKLKRHLGLEWLGDDNGASAAVPALELPAEALQALRQSLALGHVRGVLEGLERLREGNPRQAEALCKLQELARGFRLDELARQLEQANPTTTQERTPATGGQLL
ncbi:hybrid sensor histidine kinase/response regulator [Stutzerimonas kirkiae]|uniref:histidine kinase n=1 Tax=Stutzerimonas kirkiae TaxID=2211392 RepID=A0A4Q9QYZ9_9GAMM|nr:ATP-binding protein [Stutzerimonas kirkiae]TBU89532.1 hybrid sensor histidine kinase/response regulator [Stutzerimonas kirkiae]TBU98482.1 hybrid sensor histidine kinase/response regulator [Stutzerimonas kirkiae]TBV03346.1 hybrid sensor histidine kinase/response regulator [Stutzerimonas kirkiae]TBV13767.1 hybrid sensor histidine kinase/response regulator [Stutzerimonas kirkiae]